MAEKHGISSRSHVHPSHAETFADSCVAGRGVEGSRREEAKAAWQGAWKQTPGCHRDRKHRARRQN